jgi:hypothetical protein
MKINNKIKNTTLCLGMMISFASCNKLSDFGDTNVNPNDISNPTTYAILTGVETGLANWANNGNGQIWVQYFSETQYPGAGLYVIPQFAFAGNYSGQLLNLQTVIKINSNSEEVAVARILTQYIYWNMTDSWGDIPYSEALKGVVPAYDKQEDIYKGMIAELKEAQASFTNSGALKGDIIYKGDVSKWKRFANSLRVVMALRLSKKFAGAGDYAATELKAALVDGVIEDNADNCKVIFPGGDFKNPYWAAHDGARDNGESENLYNILSGFGDGRQAAFGSSTKAVPSGIKEADINTWIKNNIDWSRAFSEENRLVTSPVVIMNASQVFLARAEAADRGWTTENVFDLYQKGITASFAQWNLAAPPASYFIQPDVALTAPAGSNGNLKQIAYQRYLAAFPDGTQGWAEWRRTGFPILTPSPAPINAAHVTIPRRYIYSLAEYSLNPLGVEGAVANLPDGDVQESKVWWDQ